jgi:hypothetical protein
MKNAAPLFQAKVSAMQDGFKIIILQSFGKFYFSLLKNPVLSTSSEIFPACPRAMLSAGPSPDGCSGVIY